jgi:hypothetical protein
MKEPREVLKGDHIGYDPSGRPVHCQAGENRRKGKGHFRWIR